jgi:3-methyladenine DNA glycosylase AlkD
MAKPHGAFDAARYFRGGTTLRFYNVGTPQVRALARQIFDAHRDAWTVRDAMRLADVLIEDSYLETKAIGVEIVGRFRRSFAPRLLPAWKRWLARDLAANWATTDHICGTLIGPLLADHPDHIPLMKAWASHRNPWVRRAAAVSLIPALRRGLAQDEAYAVAATLHRDTEDLIQKAVGWMLREAGRKNADRLEAYLLRTGPVVPRTTLRYAIERFPETKRRELLAATSR